MATRKQRFVSELQQHATALARLVAGFRDLDKQWFSEGYGNGDPLTQADLTAMGNDLLLADVTAGITLAQQVVKFSGNEAVTQGDYASTIAKLRTGVG